MFRQYFHNQGPVIRFKRWSRKGYAAFMSLHRQVSIGALAVEISDRIGKKSKVQILDDRALLRATECFGTADPSDAGGGGWDLNIQNNILIVRVLNIELPKVIASRYTFLCLLVSDWNKLFLCRYD